MGYERRCRHCTCGKQSQFSQGIGGQGSGVSDLTLGPLCETNPIAPDPNEGQVPCGKEVMSSQAPNGIGKTKPICDRPSLRKEDAHGYVVSDSTGPATRCRQQEGPSDGIQGVVVLPTAWQGILPSNRGQDACDTQGRDALATISTESVRSRAPPAPRKACGNRGSGRRWPPYS